MRPLPPIYDRRGLTTLAQRQYSIAISQYYRAAIAAGVDTLHPPIPWLMDWLLEVTRRSVCTARTVVKALPRYFRAHGAPNPIADPRIQNFLIEPRLPARDPLHPQWSEMGDIQRGIWRRATHFAGQAYAPGTHANHRRHIGRYQIFARAFKFDPGSPSIDDLRAFLAWYAEIASGDSARQARDALRVYLRQLGKVELADDPAIARLVKGLRRSKPLKRRTPLWLAVLKRLLSGLGKSAPLDVRDRALLLTIYFGCVMPRDYRHLKDELVEYLPDHVKIGTDNPRRKAIYVGRLDDPDLDIELWMRRWRAIRGTDAGPLFPKLGRRGEWTSQPIDACYAWNIVQHAAKLARITEKCLIVRLRKGFIITATRRHGAIAVAEHVGFTSLDAIKVHVRVRTARSPDARRPNPFRRRRGTVGR